MSHSFFFGEDLKISILTFHSLCAGPAAPEIQDAWLGPCAAELHALPYDGEFQQEDLLKACDHVVFDFFFSISICAVGKIKDFESF